MLLITKDLQYSVVNSLQSPCQPGNTLHIQALIWLWASLSSLTLCSDLMSHVGFKFAGRELRSCWFLLSFRAEAFASMQHRMSGLLGLETCSLGLEARAPLRSIHHGQDLSRSPCSRSSWANGRLPSVFNVKNDTRNDRTLEKSARKASSRIPCHANVLASTSFVTDVSSTHVSGSTDALVVLIWELKQSSRPSCIQKPLQLVYENGGNESE